MHNPIAFDILQILGMTICYCDCVFGIWYYVVDNMAGVFDA